MDGRQGVDGKSPDGKDSDGIGADVVQLRQELAAHRQELERVQRELDETNRGVMALYAELDDRAAALARASELKSRFMSNLSHEFRTPLSSILSLSGLLLDRVDGELGLEQEKQVKFIRRSAEELLELVNDMLDLAKVESGTVTVRAAEFAVEGMLAALRGVMRPLLGSDAVTLVVEDPVIVEGGAPLVLHTDEGKVSQILRNLLSNAIKFTERGEVRLSVRLVDGDLLQLSVSDTGVGIAVADHQRVFDQFAQVDHPLQRKVKGTGLGLPLSRRLAELLGGRILVESEVGKGSRFTLEIPRVYRPVRVAEVKRTPPDPERRPVLVVEDSPDALFVYEKLLQGTQFQIVPARNLGDARRALAEFSPAAIVLDVQLRGESGWELLDELKSNEVTRNIPVIIVTVLEAGEEAMRLGADDFHTKPVERDWLLEKLKRLAARSPVDTVLIIDDDEVSRYLLKGHLAKTPYAVLEADGGELGLELARRHRPQAIFLDLIMPGMSGFEVLEALKADPVTHKIPVIAHTSKVLTDEEHRQLKAGTVDIVAKNDRSREAALSRVRDVLATAAAGGKTQDESP